MAVSFSIELIVVELTVVGVVLTTEDECEVVRRSRAGEAGEVKVD